MYMALGDRETQNTIRTRNPQGKHCTMLPVSANACLGCKNNPFGPNADPRNYQDTLHITHWAAQLGEFAMMGILPPIDRLSPSEVVAARLAYHMHTFERDKRLGEVIAAKVSEIMASIFGAKPSGG